jgi:ubiquinone/menaquinone biosynthesis C-methylase UbiE
MRENLRVRNSPEAYDRYTSDFVDEYDRAMIARFRLLYHLYGARPGVVVDVGTGTARLLARMAVLDEFAALRFIGTEYFSDIATVAHATVCDAGLGHRVHIVMQDAHQMGFRGDEIDYIISRSTVHHWAEPVKALAEIHRVLRPGGFALVHEPRRDPKPEALAHFNQIRELARVGHTTLDEKYTAIELRTFLRQAGLESCSKIDEPSVGFLALGVEIKIWKTKA